MGDSEIREQLLSYTPSILKASDINLETKKEFLTLTMTEVEKQIDRVPSDARYYILMGSLLNNIGSPEQALPYIKKAIELSPQKQAMRFELIQSLYSLGKSEETMLEAKSAYELDKNYGQAKQIYMATVQNEIKLNASFKLEGEKILSELAIK
jgi:tetratricopeptide (TPR) repeat protein